jgi:hypothetical protein
MATTIVILYAEIRPFEEREITNEINFWKLEVLASIDINVQRNVARVAHCSNHFS